MTNKNLKDDCFESGGRLLRHDEAVARFKANIRPVVGVETVPLGKASGRIVAKAIAARHPVPAHTNSAVDGYAFQHAVYAAGQRDLPVSGRAAAGHPLKTAVAAGTAVRIFTGAVVPGGLDTVALQEDSTASVAGGQDRVLLPAALKSGANVRLAGEDVAQGTELFKSGDILRPQDLAALASIGESEVACFKRLRIAVVSTGDEVIPAGLRPLAPGEVYDANAPMLRALATLSGAEVTDLGIWPDRAVEIRDRLAEAAQRFDVI